MSNQSTTITAKASDLLELYHAYSGYQYEEAADRGYDAEASRAYFKRFSEVADKLGLNIQEAQTLAYKVHSDYKTVKVNADDNDKTMNFLKGE